MLSDVSEEELSELYAWVDTIPLSKPKRSIARDMSDAVCVAEMVAHYFPKLVQLHNYSASSNSAQKVYNWSTLNQKVFRKLGFSLPRDAYEAAAFATPGTIEPILKLLRTKLAQYQAKQRRNAADGGFYGSPAAFHDSGESSGSPIEASPYLLPSSYQQNHRQTAPSPGPAPAVAAALSTSSNDDASDLIASFPGASSASAANVRPAVERYAAGGRGISAAREAAAHQEEVQELREMNSILEVKTAKLEQLLRLKDAKIAALTARLHAAGLISTGRTP